MDCINCKKATELIDEWLRDVGKFWTAEHQRDRFFEIRFVKRLRRVLKTDKEELIKRGVIPW